MNRLAIAAALVVVLLSMLFLGIAGQSGVLIAPALCLWTPAMLWLGYQLHAARVVLRSPFAVAEDDGSFT